MSLWQKLKKKWDFFLFVASLFFLSIIIAFGLGFFVADQKIFPYFQIRLAADSALCNYGLEISSLIFTEKYKKYPYLWARTTEKCSGVLVYDPSRAFKGYTLIVNNDTTASLMDMQGNVVHKWQKNFFDVWPHPKHVKPLTDPVPQELIFWNKVFLYPNGDLLAVYSGPFTPYGAGVIKINAQSELLWKADINAHHDLAVSEDGRIWVLTHKYNYDDERPRIDDYITILSPQGKILQEISIYKAIRESSYYNLVPGRPYDDYLHTNNVDLLGSDKADGFPFFNAGDILLSHRESVCITVIDGNTFRTKWALAGVARFVHDADFLEKGRIAFFDNTAYKQGSQIMEWDCLMNKPHWQFTPSDYYNGFNRPLFAEDNFYSLTSGMQQKLPNGNYLIVETDGGTMFEVTADKKVVWKYVSTKLDKESIGRLFCAERYPANYLKFLSLPCDK